LPPSEPAQYGPPLTNSQKKDPRSASSAVREKDPKIEVKIQNQHPIPSITREKDPELKDRR
jgi:hypothetical protein